MLLLPVAALETLAPFATLAARFAVGQSLLGDVFRVLVVVALVARGDVPLPLPRLAPSRRGLPGPLSSVAVTVLFVPPSTLRVVRLLSTPRNVALVGPPASTLVVGPAGPAVTALTSRLRLLVGPRLPV